MLHDGIEYVVNNEAIVKWQLNNDNIEDAKI